MCKKVKIEKEACQERLHTSEDVPALLENKNTTEEVGVLPRAFEDYIQRWKRQAKLNRLVLGYNSSFKKS